MSRHAEDTVWERSRAKGSNLLVLLVIADNADPDGRDAFPGVRRLARVSRMSERAVRLVLHKLERDGEIIIDVNAEGRTITIGRRTIRPEWFIHVRCVCDAKAYDAGVAAGKSDAFRPGRRPRPNPEKIADSPAVDNRQSFPANRKKDVEQPEKFSLAYKEEILEQDPRTAEAAAAARWRQDIDTTIGALVVAWNTAIRPPMLMWGELTETRRRLVRAALVERSHAEWTTLFARAAASRFLNGGGPKGFVASLDWLLSTPDAVVKLREGFYDDRIIAGRYTPSPATHYGDWDCPHRPHCGHPSRCDYLKQLAAERGQVSA